ncbi:MAG: F390 synthetase-related protein [Bacteroidota bacterium]
MFKLRIIGYLLQFKWTKWIYKNRLPALKRKRMKRLMKHLQQSPFYSDLLSQNVSFEDFPIINKAFFMENFDQINVKGIQKKDALEIAFQAEQSRDFSPEIQGITIGLSSGTSGNTGVFLVSEKERARWVAVVLDRVIGFSFRKRKVAFFLRANSNLYESAKSSILEFRFFDIFLPFQDHLDRISSFRPHIIVAQPSVLKPLADAQKKGNIQLKPEKILSVAEVLYPEDKAYLEDVFQTKVEQVYQCTEGFLGASKNGVLHINEDFIHLEKRYVDDKKERFYPIITDMLRFTQPVIRYELNDILVEKKEGTYEWPGLALERIEGRSDDTWIFQDLDGEKVRIFSDLVRRTVIKTSEKITYYMLSQTGEKQISVYLEVKKSEDDQVAIQEAMAKNMQDLFRNFRLSPIEIIFLSELPHHAGSKLRRIRNEFI